MLATIDEGPCVRLNAAVDELADESIERHGAETLGQDMIAIRHEIDRLEAQFIRRAQRFDRQRGALADGAASTVSWMRGRCGLTGAAAAERVRMARVLDDLPLTTDSFSAGRAPFSNVSMIARLAEAVGTEATRGVEETLVTAAEKIDAGRMCRLAMYTRHCIDADGVLAQDNRNFDRRWFACDQMFDGSFLLRGQLDAEGGALVKAAVDASSLRRGPEDNRTGSQRRADAVVDMASALLHAGTLASEHGERPHLVLTASVETLSGVHGSAPAEIRGVGPVNLETARRLACDSSRRLAAVDSAAVDADAGEEDQGIGPARASAAVGAVVDRSMSIGRASRTVPPAMRTAIAARDRGCRYPGCDRPPEWTDAHHIHHWADGGETAVANLVSLCRFHHRMVHEQGRDIRLAADGGVEVSDRGARDPTFFHRGL
jgi:hypothetical protein